MIKEKGVIGSRRRGMKSMCGFMVYTANDIKVEDFELDNLIYTIKEQILRNEENIAEEVVDKYYIDFANILYSYIKSNKDINYKYI